MENKECYSIIKDRQSLIDFIEWLPDLKEDETFYVCLMARKKYCKDLIKANDKQQLKRFTANKNNLLQKIDQLEIPLGKWLLRDKQPAPEKSLVLYINPNPRHMVKATWKMDKKIRKLLKNNSKGYNIHAEAMSCIQKAKSKSFCVLFDIDSKDIDLNEMSSILPKRYYKVLETRGGYHIIVDSNIPKGLYTIDPKNPSNTISYRNWYIKICETYKNDIDQTGDQMIPVVGCTQGGFVPKFVV